MPVPGDGVNRASEAHKAETDGTYLKIKNGRHGRNSCFYDGDEQKIRLQILNLWFTPGVDLQRHESGSLWLVH